MPIYKQSVNGRHNDQCTLYIWHATWRVCSAPGHLWHHKWPGYTVAW